MHCQIATAGLLTLVTNERRSSSDMNREVLLHVVRDSAGWTLNAFAPATRPRNATTGIIIVYYYNSSIGSRYWSTMETKQRVVGGGVLVGVDVIKCEYGN